MAKRRRQTIQWPKEEGRQYNGQKKKADNTMAKREKEQKTNNNLQTTTKKAKDEATQTKKVELNSDAPESKKFLYSGITPVINHE
jgi:hypothetical protein